VKGTKEDTSTLEGHSAKYLADRWGFPYREAQTLSIDPTVLEILDREESKRLRVLPLEHGPDGPVFAVAEPSEERFAAVRDIAGDNASFVIVAKDTLDALLNSKVFSVPGHARRGASLLRVQDDGTEPVDGAEHQAGAGEGEAAAEAEHAEHAEHASEGEGHETHSDNGSFSQNGSHADSAGHSENGQSTEALDDLLNQITAGTGNLRAQVNELTESLETAQREVREANEQLAEATRVNEEHDAVVDSLRAEVETLRADLERSTTLNESMKSRLEDVVRALTAPTSNDDTASG
jgi:hypothetical protein